MAKTIQLISKEVSLASSKGKSKNESSRKLVVNDSEPQSGSDLVVKGLNGILNGLPVNMKQYNLDQKIASTLGSTKPNSKTRENFLNGLVKFGEISQDEKDYLMKIN